MDSKRKCLMLASVASMIDQFNVPNIELLISLGYSVDVVADFSNPGNISAERAKELVCRLKKMNTRVIDIAIPRSLNPYTVTSAYKSIKKLLKQERYDLIHCHSPIGGALVRFASRKIQNTKVIYTAHGFHFYSGAPMLNWIVFYPVEKVCARWTDVLITINKEDFIRAKKHFKTKKIEYMPGIGIDVQKFSMNQTSKSKKREEFGIQTNSLVLMSVGELNDNKNHELVIRVLPLLNNSKIHYVVVGKGNKEHQLKSMAEELGVNDRVHFLGYRQDIPDLYKMADVYVLPSLREGLNVSLMEAMASGLPCLVGRIRGNRDLIEDDSCFFDPKSTKSLYRAIKSLNNGSLEDIGKRNQQNVKKCDINEIQRRMKKIYVNADQGC